MLFVALLPHFAWAHGGEDHGDSPPPAPMVSSSPRVYMSTDQFELVGFMNGKTLRIYLDQFGTNKPVIKAQIEVESAEWKALATETEPAVYTVEAALLEQPGRHPLTITVQAGDESDLMSAVLEVGQTDKLISAEPHTHFRSEWAIWTGATALLLAALALVAKRRRKHSQKHK